MEKIIKKIEEQIAVGVYLGASVSIFDEGRWQRTYLGHSQPGQPTRENLIYDLASVSKVVGVGTICLYLLERGQLDLDASLTTYYPDFQHSQITIRQLLTHTSGLDPFIKNRDILDFSGLKSAMNTLTLRGSCDVHYTDVNFILLGFMLENLYHKDLATIFFKEIFEPLGMRQTSFGPVEVAVPTQKNQPAGVVHDPKARVLGRHAGSAGLFSNLVDLELFLEHYLRVEFALDLTKDYAYANKLRSLAWDLRGEWLLHTGYTGTFILFNRKSQQAVIFLSNRTYEKDEREQWISDRDELIALILTVLEDKEKA